MLTGPVVGLSLSLIPMVRLCPRRPELMGSFCDRGATVGDKGVARAGPVIAYQILALAS
jgi:hypothetical protein